MDSSSQTTSIDLNVQPNNNALSYNDSNLQSSQNMIDLNNFLDVDNSLGNAPIRYENMRHRSKKKNLTSETKKAVYKMLLLESHEGKLKKGVLSKVANAFSISRKSVSRIWHYSSREGVPDFSSKLVKRVGRKRVEHDFEKIKDIPFHRRTNIRSLSNALDMSKSTVHRRIKEGYIRPHSNSVKPYLSEDNKKARLEFCLSMIENRSPTSKPSFVNMHDHIHIDEKWFYMTKTTQKYYLHPDEAEPYRTCKSKRFITKIMFLSVIACPRFDAISNKDFDGKIGIWSFVCKEAAKRRSKNRAADTLETKPILSVTKDVIRYVLIEKLLPTIKEKWPSSSCKTIFIQQDNAKPHLDVNDIKFVEAARKDGFDIRLCCQLANSSDMNVLDLGFFRAIDSLQHQEAPTTVDEIVSAVEKSFDTFPIEDLNCVFLTLQSCMIEVMKIFGGNNYKIPHMNKQNLIRNRHLPECIECDPRVLDEAKLALC